MLWYRNLRMVAKIVLPVGLVLIVALGLLTWQIQSRSSAAIQTIAQRELTALASQYGNYMQSFFEVPLDEGMSLAHAWGKLAEDELLPHRSAALSMLRGVQKGNPGALSVGAIWEPNAYDGNDTAAAGTSGSDAKGRFVPYLAAGQSVTTVNDYLASDYYLTPKNTKESYLAKPYTYTVNGKQILMTTASSPILSKGEFKGVVVTDISLESIAQIVNQIKIYQNGLTSVVTQEGIVVADRNPAYVGKNLFTELNVPMADKAATREAFRQGEPRMEIVHGSQGSTIDYYYPIHFRGTEQHWYFVVSAPLDEVLEEANTIREVTIGMSAGVLVLVLLLIFFVVRSSARPIAVLAGAAGEIAKGKLDTAIHDDKFGGEVKELSTAFKNMITSLLENIAKAEQMSADANKQAEKAQQAMQDAEEAGKQAQAKTESMLLTAERLEEVAQIVSSASSELSAQIEQSERGAADQAVRVTQTATAMEEMNSTVLEVARNASQASDVSASTKRKAEEGAAVVKRAVASITTVQQQSRELRQDMTTLDENARAISQIMGVISDIADQTNLLALNAAIEAARAGEAGRGFAVVADEVRKLAEKTMASTTDVGKAIQAIQASATKSMNQVDATVDTIAEATTLAEQSGAALQEIVSMADHTADQVRAIATASEQQSASSEEINQSIGQVNSIAGETARAMQEAAGAVSDLAGQAQVLSNLITEMKRG